MNRAKKEGRKHDRRSPLIAVRLGVIVFFSIVAPGVIVRGAFVVLGVPARGPAPALQDERGPRDLSDHLGLGLTLSTLRRGVVVALELLNSRAALGTLELEEGHQ